MTAAQSSFSVDVVVDNVANLGAYEFTLAFDPAIMSFLGAVNGPFLGSTGRAVLCFPPSPLDGSARLNCVTLGSEPAGPSGSGVLATITFAPLATGTSALDLTKVVLTDAAGIPMPHTVQHGAVTVAQRPTPTPCVDGTCPTATSTLTPTATPTPGVGPTTVLIDPPSQGQLTGTTFTVNVAVENVADLAAYEFILAFNPAVLEFMDVSNGPFLGSSGRAVSCPPPTVGANTVRFGCVTPGSPPGVSGSGVLAVLTFSASEMGTAVLDLFNVALASPMGLPLPTAVEDGSVTVSLAPTPTPTPCDGECPTATTTPTPTVTPTPTPTPIPVPCLVGSGVDVCFQPVYQNASEGANFSLDISADDVDNLGAFEFTAVFDPNIAAFASIEEGPFLGSTGRPVTCLVPALTVDSVHYACVTLGVAPPGPSGAGVLATVTLFAAGAGTSVLTLEDVKLTDIVGTEMPATSHHASVTVLAGPTPTPGPTGTATTTPTPTVTSTPGPETLTFVDPASLAASVGSNFTVDIAIQQVSNLGSYEWLLFYNEALLDFVSVSNGPFLGSTGRSVFCPGVIVDVGSVRFGCSTTGATPPGPDGAGVLSTITFSAQAEGTSPLDLVWVQLSDPLAEDIPSSLQDGSVTVNPAPTPTPTATPGGGASLPSKVGAGPMAAAEADRERNSTLFLAPGLLGGPIIALGLSSVLRLVRRARRS